MVKAFYKYMKAFLTPKIRKSVPELAFVFGKSDFLDLVNFDFLNLAKFITIDKFSIFLSTLFPSALPAVLNTS